MIKKDAMHVGETSREFRKREGVVVVEVRQ